MQFVGARPSVRSRVRSPVTSHSCLIPLSVELLSRVIVIKYGCFTFNESAHCWENIPSYITMLRGDYNFVTGGSLENFETTCLRRLKKLK